MARLSQVPYPANERKDPSATAIIELGQSLYRLQQTVLHPTAEREHRLRTSEHERARLESNLEYARTVLTQLERDTLGIKAPSRRSEVQGTLNQHRELLELLFDRLEDIRKIAVEDEYDSDGEDLLSEIIPTPSESMNSASGDGAASETAEDTSSDHLRGATSTVQATSLPEREPEPETPPAPVPEPHPQTAYTHTTQTMRSRRTAQTPSPTPSQTAHSTARAALFANRRKPAPPQTSTATAEAILDQQRLEQDALSESILKMAGALKASSQKFSTTLDQDKDVLGRAGEGMDKTERSMEAARGRMGALRRMTEGKGWWGRMILYAWVYGMMVTLVLMVFVLPKLRF
ncbi:hypothetical protein S40288_02834 [Stachybotrys chartarum IBT 40288]|nr:hypothetical protein S40288_02834 [Stachybotrys chartarum IBT 40288]